MTTSVSDRHTPALRIFYLRMHSHSTYVTMHPKPFDEIEKGTRKFWEPPKWQLVQERRDVHVRLDSKKINVDVSIYEYSMHSTAGINHSMNVQIRPYINQASAYAHSQICMYVHVLVCIRIHFVGTWLLYTYIACIHTLHACVHACIHTYVHTYVNTYVHTYVYTNIHACTHAHMRTQTSTTCTHTHNKMFMHTLSIYIHTCTHIQLYQYLSMHMPIYAYTCA